MVQPDWIIFFSVSLSSVSKTSGTLFFARKDTMYVFEVKFSGFECLPGIF